MLLWRTIDPEDPVAPYSAKPRKLASLKLSGPRGASAGPGAPWVWLRSLWERCAFLWSYPASLPHGRETISGVTLQRESGFNLEGPTELQPVTS